jgi:predicted RNase H-like nuclease
VRGQAARAGPPDRERDRIEAFCPNPKKTTAGASERLGLLQAVFAHGIDVAGIRARLGKSRVLSDDLLDAAACLATARRILEERAHVLPEGPGERDARGLRMEIVA